jgi:hypothetical protein
VSRAHSLALLLCAALPIGACGGGSEESGGVSAGFESRVAENVEFELPVNSTAEVDCPDDVSIRKGVPFECSVTGSEGSGTVTVTPDADGGTAGFAFEGVLEGPRGTTEFEGTDL